MSSRPVVLEVEGLSTRFSVPAGEVRAVDGVSFTLRRGTTLGVVGESGSGKTVLSRTIMRLNTGRNVSTQGVVRFEGVDLLGLTNKQMNDIWGVQMSMIFQDPMTSLNPVVKIGRQLTEHVRRHLGFDKAQAREVAIALLRSVHIPEPAKRFDVYPHQLSGGMRQRVCIAIALACGPSLIIGDEPTTALDVTVQHQILNLLREQQRDRDMAMILITHDLAVVAGRADEVAVMYAGRIVEKAPTARLFRDVKHPYTESLMRCIPRTDQAVHSRLSVISGRPPDLITPRRGCSFSPRCPYAQPRCFDEAPPTETLTDGHEFSCFFPVGTDEGRAAFEANLAAGRPETVAVATGDTLVEEPAEAS